MADPFNDGPDCDGDGIVDATDPDDDDDGVLDGDDPAPCDPEVTEELVDVWAFVHDDTNGNGVTDVPGDALLTGWAVRLYDDTGLGGGGFTALIPPPPPFLDRDIGVYLGAFPAGAEVDVCAGILSGWVALSPPAGPTGEACFDATIPAGADASLYHFLMEREVVNQPPTAEAGGPYLVGAGQDVVLDGSGSTDPDGDPLTHSWTGGSFADPSTATPTLTAPGEAGIYEVELTVDDGKGGIATDTAIVVVYDPDGGFVTGGGWLEAPDGSCVDTNVCADTGGRANFGFVAKYQKGKTVPSGKTAFTFDAGTLSFHSTRYEALIVNGSSGGTQYWGSGTIGGTGTYDFKVWATDGDVAGGDDTFRIQIRNTDGTVVFDNGIDQAIGGGAITVHDKKQN